MRTDNIRGLNCPNRLLYIGIKNQMTYHRLFLRLNSALSYSVLIIISLAMLPACGGDDMGGSPNSRYGYDNNNPECGAMGQICLSQPINSPLALGSHTELLFDFRMAGTSGVSIDLEQTNPLVLNIDGMAVEAVGTGMSGLLFVGSDDTVIDYIHLWVTEAEELRIISWSNSGDLLGYVRSSIVLLVGDELLISVEPFENAQPLLGNFEMNRVIEGESIAIVPDPVGGWYRVVARSEGQSTVRFNALQLETVLEIEVIP